MNKSFTGGMIPLQTVRIFTHMIIGVFCLLTSPLWSAGASGQTLPQGDFSDLRPMDTDNVVCVVSPSTLELSNAGIVRLSGIYFPDYTETDPGPFSILAVKILKDMLEDQSVKVFQTRKDGTGRTNRMGHSLVHLVRESDGAWIQGSLLRLGLAVVQTTQNNPEQAPQMLKLEAQAAQEKLGLWEKDFKIISPEETPAHIGEFVVVEGQTQSVAMKTNRLFINFGQNWRDDFTVTVAPENRKGFSRAGLNPLDWNARQIKVRGWLSELNGPNMEIDHPEAIELPEQAAPSDLSAPPEPSPEQKDNALPAPLPVNRSDMPKNPKG